MPGFGSVFVLASKKGCLGVREGKNEAEIICSFSSGAIEVYNVHDHCCIHSWPLQTSDHLTCPAVYHPYTAKYWAVRNECELLTWSEESERLDHCCRELPSAVHALLVSPSLPYLVVVYSKGAIGLVGKGDEVALTSRATRSNRLEIHHCALYSHDGGEYVGVVYSLVGQSYVCVCAVKEGVLQPPLTTKLDRGPSEGVPSVCCMCGCNLVTLWSDGTLTCTDVSLLPGASLSPTWHTHVHTSTPHTIAAVSEDYFTLGACEGEVSLWDTTYATCQASTDIRDKDIHLQCVSGFVFAVSSEGVSVCSVESGGGGVLAAALGRRGEQMKDSLVVVPEWVEPNMDPSQWEADTSQANREERDFIATLSDHERTPTLKTFTNVFQSRPLSPGVCYSSVVKRLLGDQRFWARGHLIQLLEAELFPFSLSGDLLETSLLRKDWALVSIALQHIEGLPEDVLVNLIQEALGLPETVRSHGVVVRRRQLLYQLLSQPRNDALTHQPLSQMPFPLVLSLLEFLHQHVTMATLLAVTSDPQPMPYPAVLEWVGLLLDVHFTQLTLAPETRELLLTLHKSVIDQVIFFKALTPLQSLIEMLKNSSSVQKDTKWLYRVDKLHLTV